MLIDTHCHIHEDDYPLDVDQVIAHAHENGVDQMICVGTSVAGSRQAIEFAAKHPEAFAAIGIHPHYADAGIGDLDKLFDKDNKKIVAVGEIGLDYHYNYSSHENQKELLKAQIELAQKHNLPIIFHVREAFDDFWPIFDTYSGIVGVMHGYSDNSENVQKAIDRGLYIGVTGISTFTKDPSQQQMFATIPLGKVLLETDAPYLTPVPFRGKVNEPAYVRCIADYSGKARQISIDEVADITLTNARKLFSI